MSALDVACSTCAAALVVSRAEFGRYVTEARKAGWRGLDAIEAAYLAVADPNWDRKSPAGRRPANAVIAAIWRGSPRRERDRESRLRSALRGAVS